MKVFNSQLFPDAIGFAVYTFEGIGVILPIMEVTENKDNYYKILCVTISLLAVFYVVWTELMVVAWGNQLTTPLITDQLPQKSVITYILKILFTFNLLFSYPLVIHPANLVVESWLFSTWPKSRKRQLCKNVSRTLIVVLSCVVALAVYDKLDRFLSITGALTCIPIAFILPAALHYKACAETPLQRGIDLTITIVSIVMMVFCTIMAVITFNA